MPKCLSIMVLVMFLAGCIAPAKRPAQTPTPARPSNLSWDGSIGALLNDKYASCHGQVTSLSYATYESALRGSMHGPSSSPVIRLTASWSSNNHRAITSVNSPQQN